MLSQLLVPAMPTCYNPETSVGHLNNNASHCERILVASGRALLENNHGKRDCMYSKRKRLSDTFSKYATNDCDIFFMTHFYGLSGC